MFLVYVATFTLMFVLPEGLSEAFETDTVRDDLEIGTEEIQVTESDLTALDTFNSFVDNEESETTLESNETVHYIGTLGNNFVSEIIWVTGNENHLDDDENRSQALSQDTHKLEDGPMSFNLHPPYFHSEVEEFVFSPWYFLVFSIVNRSSSLSADVSSMSTEISESLSSKLSVPSSVFFISSIVKYTSSDTFLSVNLSLVSPIIPNLHHKLCNLHKESPFFWIRGTNLELYQVRHKKNQHIHVTNHKDVSTVHNNYKPTKLPRPNQQPKTI
jgi:hypothetical protein